MHKKGNGTIGHLIVTGLIVIGMLLSGFFGYVTLLTDYNTPVSSSIETENLTLIYGNLTANADYIELNATKTPATAGLDFLSTGIGSIRAAFATIGSIDILINFFWAETPLDVIPDEIRVLIGAIIVVSIIFITIGAIWRYKMK